MKDIFIRLVYDRLIIFVGSTGFSLVAYLVARLLFN